MIHTFRYSEGEGKLFGMAAAFGIASPTATAEPAEATAGLPEA